MTITLHNIRPSYMSEDELSASDIFLVPEVTFESPNKYLVRAESGRGKSSLLDFIFGANTSFEGSIDSDVARDDEWRKSRLSYVFQDLKLFPELSVMDNLRLKNNLTDHNSEEEMMSYLDGLGVAIKCESKVGTLSLGQRQRVAIARALCQPFEMLLLDEPFSHLDDTNSSITADLLANALEERQAGLIVTSLGPDTAFSYDVEYRL